MLDLLMLRLATAEKILTDANIPFEVVITLPRSKKFQLLDDHHYVLRQSFRDGVCHLVVAAKMGKEV